VLKAVENVELPLHLTTLPKSKRLEHARRALSLVGEFCGCVRPVGKEGVAIRLLSRRAEELEMGKATADCTAPHGGNFWSVPSFLLDQGYQCASVFVNGSFFCRLDCVLVQAGGKRALVIDSEEAIPQSDSWEKGAREEALGKALSLVEQWADSFGARVYCMAYSNREWMKDFIASRYPEEKVKISKAGGVSQLRDAVKLLCGVDVRPAIYLQSFSLRGMSIGEASTISAFEAELVAALPRSPLLRKFVDAGDLRGAAVQITCGGEVSALFPRFRHLMEYQAEGFLESLYGKSGMEAEAQLRSIGGGAPFRALAAE
jgi:hypothetical protein